MDTVVTTSVPECDRSIVAKFVMFIWCVYTEKLVNAYLYGV
jgi:hypothetical protein